MSDSSHLYLLEVVHRLKGWVDSDKITQQEFVENLFHSFAHIAAVYPTILPDLWDAIPNSCREKFLQHIHHALQPNFRRTPFARGGSVAMTEEELRSESERDTARVKAWALAFKRFLDLDEYRDDIA